MKEKQNKKVFVWSHLDLDGVVSYLVVRWFYGFSVPVIFTTPLDFRNEFAAWSKENFDKYDRIYILDMDVTSSQDLVDFDKVCILDHHVASHTAQYKKAKAGVKVCTSAAKLAYMVFSKMSGANFTKAQRTLIAMADDYDSYSLQSPLSDDLNTLLFESQHKPFDFIEDFKDGFTGFNQIQRNIITLYKRKLKKILDEIQVYHQMLLVQGKTRNVVGAFATDCINEVARKLSEQYNGELVFVVNLKTNRVSWRRRNDSDVDVSKLANILCEGGGREETAGGQLTQKFIEFTKTLVPVN